MTDPDSLSFGYETPEADVVEQRMAVGSDDDGGWSESVRLAGEGRWDASEADLIDQAIAVPLPDDELGFDR
jgi:hypothetical protein